MKTSLTTIGILRFPLMILVVYAHMVSFETSKISLTFSIDHFSIFIKELLSNNLGRLPVPCFFLFSGYLFFLKVYNWNKEIYKSSLIKKIKTLLVPYLLWNTIYIVIIILKNLVFKNFGLSQDENYTYIAGTPFYQLLTDPVYFAFWYIRDLLIMILLTPIFYFLIKKLDFLFLVILCVFYLSTLEIPYFKFNSTSVMFFGMGAFFGIKKIDFVSLSIKYNNEIIVVSTILLLLSLFYNGSVYYEKAIRPFVLIGIFTVFYIGYQISLSPSISKNILFVTPATFFIYATHQIYLLGWIKGFFAKFSHTSLGIGGIISYLISPIICCAICVLLYMLFNKYIPKILSFSIGNR